MDLIQTPVAEDQVILDLRHLAAYPTPEAARDLLEQWDGLYDRRDAWRAQWAPTAHT
jgi:hypothetical protein